MTSDLDQRALRRLTHRIHPLHATDVCGPEPAADDVDAEQRDFRAYQAARRAIDQQRCLGRLEHARFQDLLRLCQRHVGDLETDASIRLRLNPIRSWAKLTTDWLLPEGLLAPAHVLFLADGDHVVGAVLELEGQALLNELADGEPMTLGEWSASSRLAGREELQQFCRELFELGALAWS